MEYKKKLKLRLVWAVCYLILGITMVVTFWFSQVSVGGGYVSDILGPSLLAAIGLGAAFVPDTIAAVSGVEPREAGRLQQHHEACAATLSAASRQS